MIAVDTNILVHAHRTDSDQHGPAREALERLATIGRPWAVPWPCLHEFLAIVTHPRIYRPPSDQDVALTAVDDLVRSPPVVTLSESSDHAHLLNELCSQPGVVGPKVHDARVAAICLGHDVDELWSADRDFSLFPRLRTTNPLVGR